ncbi:MAG: peptidylprolyl isomerase [Candidatus Dadabacteria bacterium]|nr:MAG: peptidylprolyl isomerase [Candidatus Dadabacteria bacterium]
MTITKDKVVELDMTITEKSGEVLDSTEGGAPLVYLHGAGNLIPALEIPLEGKNIGDSVAVEVSPESGYGERDENLVRVVERAQLGGVDNIDVGMQFQAQSPAGVAIFTVTAVDGDNITLDGNHPLAGKDLKFDLTVKSIRDATPEEIEHGHVHQAG